MVGYPKSANTSIAYAEWWKDEMPKIYNRLNEQKPPQHNRM